MLDFDIFKNSSKIKELLNSKIEPSKIKKLDKINVGYIINPTVYVYEYEFEGDVYCLYYYYSAFDMSNVKYKIFKINGKNYHIKNDILRDLYEKIDKEYRKFIKTINKYNL